MHQNIMMAIETVTKEARNRLREVSAFGEADLKSEKNG